MASTDFFLLIVTISSRCQLRRRQKAMYPRLLIDDLNSHKDILDNQNELFKICCENNTPGAQSTINNPQMHEATNKKENKDHTQENEKANAEKKRPYTCQPATLQH